MASGREILTRARAAFRSARVPETLRAIAVPEWDCSVYYWPVRSTEERLSVERHIRLSGDRTVADLTAVHVSNVCARARDQHGERLFTAEDEAGLRDTDSAVVERISLTMGIGSGGTVEDAEKN